MQHTTIIPGTFPDFASDSAGTLVCWNEKSVCEECPHVHLSELHRSLMAPLKQWISRAERGGGGGGLLIFLKPRFWPWHRFRPCHFNSLTAAALHFPFGPWLDAFNQCLFKNPQPSSLVRRLSQITITPPSGINHSSLSGWDAAA